MVLATLLAYPSGEEGGNFLLQIISTWLRYAKRGGGGGAWARVDFTVAALKTFSEN
jgi:hypothetical protein